MEWEIEMLRSRWKLKLRLRAAAAAAARTAAAMPAVLWWPWRYAPKTMVTPADSDGNGGSTSQDRQDDMQQENELMEIDDDNDDGDDDEEEEVESTDGVHSEDASYRTCRRVYQHPYFSLNGHFHHCPRLCVVGRPLLSFAGGFKKNLDLERFVCVCDVGESFVIAP